MNLLVRAKTSNDLMNMSLKALTLQKEETHQSLSIKPNPAQKTLFTITDDDIKTFLFPDVLLQADGLRDDWVGARDWRDYIESLFADKNVAVILEGEVSPVDSVSIVDCVLYDSIVNEGFKKVFSEDLCSAHQVSGPSMDDDVAAQEFLAIKDIDF